MAVASVAGPHAGAVRSSSKMLQLGSTGPEVLKLQKALAAAGFNPKGLDGKFGPMTQAALKAFQKAAKIVVDGKAGPQTWNALAPSLSKGAQGPQVKVLQTLLQAHGLKPGGVDGKFGPVTHQAVVAFQKARGLAGSGLVGPRTWALLRGSAQGTAPAPVPPATGGSSAAITKMLAWAKSMQGSKYAAVNPFRFGEVLWDGKPHKSVNGSGTVFNYPKGTRVFDCSGFIVTAFKQLGVDLKARGLTSSWAMHDDTKFLKPVARADIKPGDLITYIPKNGVGHVVIYLGNGKCIEAAGGVGVVIRDVAWDRLRGIRRVPVP